jgi:hypothetical protein
MLFLVRFINTVLILGSLLIGLSNGHLPRPVIPAESAPRSIVPHTMTSDSRIDDLREVLFEEGLKVRKAVIGKEYVERSLANATPFTKVGQELVSQNVWGTIWTRPGLDLKQRSLISKLKDEAHPLSDMGFLGSLYETPRKRGRNPVVFE